MAAQAVRAGLRRKTLGSTGLQLPVIGFGGAAVMFGGSTGMGETRCLGEGQPQGFRFPSDDEAHATLRTTWDLGVRYFDTAPWYGRGQSEHRFGRALYDIEPREDLILSTKVGRILTKPVNRALTFDTAPSPQFGALAGYANGGMGSSPQLGLEFDHVFDYSYDGIMRAYEDSLQRLGMNRVDTLVIHDLDRAHFTEGQVGHHLNNLFSSGWRALETLKASGEIKAYGAGINHVGNMTQFMDLMELDFFLVSQIYSLLHHGNITEFGVPTNFDGADAFPGKKNVNDVEGGALAEFERVRARGMGVVAATVYNSGMLINGAKGETCNYRPPTAQERARVAALEAVCAQHEVPLPAAALQFPLAHPVVASMVVGFSKPSEAEQAMDWLDVEIPTAFWRQLKEENLIDQAAPTPE